MVKTQVRVRTNKDASGALDSATRRYLLDGMQVGFNRAREEAPVGATGFLQGQAMQEPRVESDGSVSFANLAAYAEAVHEGTAPHFPPIAPLIRWARRVLGDAGAAYGVQQKIGAEGTDANPFMERGADAARAWFGSRSLSTYFEDRL